MRDDPFSLNTFTDNELNVVQRPDCKWNRFVKDIQKIEKNKAMPGPAGKNHLLDINCWLLLFHGYPHHDDKRFARLIIEQDDIDVNHIRDSLFSANVKRLFTVFHFDIRSFYEVWMYQHNIVRLLHQVVRDDFFIGNRFVERKKRKWKPKFELICYPTRYDTLPVPKVNRILDGLLFPVVVCKNNGDVCIERLEITNFGDGDFITCAGNIIDCIRVNDFWLTRSHLKQRLAFSFLVESDYDEAPMIICNNMKDIGTAWKMLDANPDDGVLIRSLGENLYQNYWLLLNRDSAFLSIYTKDNFTFASRNPNPRGFVTLDGKRIGNLGYSYTALKNMMWLDAFDIERFKKIVFQDMEVKS